jgi:hypothetical protein
LAKYITESYDKAAFMTASRLGKTVGVSESTVVRFAVELGFEGYPSMQKAMQDMVLNRLTSVQRIEAAHDRLGHEDVVASVLQSDAEKLRQTMEMLDRNAFNAAVKATFPNRVTWITSIEEFNRSEWLMRNIGCIAKRKFTKDPLVVKHCLRTIKNKGILIIYPEARFSFAGIPEHIDGALGKLVKTSKCPLIIMRNNGHYIQSPQFSKHPYRKIPLLSEFEQVVTREQVSTLTADEI